MLLHVQNKQTARESFRGQSVVFAIALFDCLLRFQCREATVARSVFRLFGYSVCSAASLSLFEKTITSA